MSKVILCFGRGPFFMVWINTDAPSLARLTRINADDCRNANIGASVYVV